MLHAMAVATVTDFSPFSLFMRLHLSRCLNVGLSLPGTCQEDSTVASAELTLDYTVVRKSACAHCPDEERRRRPLRRPSTRIRRHQVPGTHRSLPLSSIVLSPTRSAHVLARVVVEPSEPSSLVPSKGGPSACPRQALGLHRRFSPFRTRGRRPQPLLVEVELLAPDFHPPIRAEQPPASSTARHHSVRHAAHPADGLGLRVHV